MNNAGNVMYIRCIESLDSLEQMIEKKNTIELRVAFAKILLDIFTNIDMLSYHEAATIMERIKAISMQLSIKSHL